MEVHPPLLSQDEFFRHLELQSVHTVKFTAYRQALKERLRATTKLDSISATPRVSGGKRINGKNAVGGDDRDPAATNVSLSRRRILSRAKGGGHRREAAATEDPRAANPAASALEPLVQSCQLYLHPRMREELDRYHRGSTARRASGILERCDYYKVGDNNSLLAAALMKKKKTGYETFVRLQKSAPATTSTTRSEPVRPGDFPLGPAAVPPSAAAVSGATTADAVSPSVAQQPVTAAAVSPLLRQSSPSSRLRPRRSPEPADLLGCRNCDERFTSRSRLQYHERHGHPACRVCRRVLLLWKRARSDDDVCDECTAGSEIPSAAKKGGGGGKARPGSDLRCDLCSKVFARRRRMIKHVMSQHSSEVHKVDLLKFVNMSGLKKNAASMPYWLET